MNGYEADRTDTPDNVIDITEMLKEKAEKEYWEKVHKLIEHLKKPNKE